MIKNSKQLEVSKNRLREFQSALSELQSSVEQAHIILHKAQISAIKSSIEGLEKEIEIYESLKKGAICHIKGGNIEEIARMLIQTRLAKGMTQAKLGEEIGIDQQQIQRYEATDYEGISLARLFDIIDALEVSFELDNITTGKIQFAASAENDEVQHKIYKQGQIFKIVA